MSETDGPDRDEELDRARLRALDPAASLPPADPDWVARLLEDTMSHDVDTPLTHESRETGTHDRSPLTWLVAAAAILVIAGVGVFATDVAGGRPGQPAERRPELVAGDIGADALGTPTGGGQVHGADGRDPGQPANRLRRDRRLDHRRRGHPRRRALVPRRRGRDQ